MTVSSRVVSPRSAPSPTPAEDVYRWWQSDVMNPGSITVKPLDHAGLGDQLTTGRGVMSVGGRAVPAVP